MSSKNSNNHSKNNHSISENADENKENLYKHSKAEIEQIFKAIIAKSGPIELDHVNDYTLLVAVVLSARATDKGVNKATKALFEKVQTPQQMLELGLESSENAVGLEEYVKTIGLYKNKAKNIMALSKLLIEKHGGKVPGTLEELEALPGVGRKTANVILNELFNLPTFPVDTHVFRVSNRLGLCSQLPGGQAKNPLQTEKVLKEIVPAEYAVDAAQSLVLHGRYVCKAIKPKCNECTVSQWCEYYKNTKNIIKPSVKKQSVKKI